MSVGMSAAWRAKQPKQKRCNRCELYTPEIDDKCIHCAGLNKTQLTHIRRQLTCPVGVN